MRAGRSDKRRSGRFDMRRSAPEGGVNWFSDLPDRDSANRSTHDDRTSSVCDHVGESPMVPAGDRSYG